MISSITIENYRLFSRLQVSRLGHVNLIVGRNNAGKSAFLEAVRLLSTRGSNRSLAAIVMGRANGDVNRIHGLLDVANPSAKALGNWIERWLA